MIIIIIDGIGWAVTALIPLPSPFSDPAGGS